MNRGQMARRCPTAVVVQVGRLAGYRFIINARGYATIVPDPADAVHGVVWRLEPTDEAALDHYEGVAEGLYRKETVTVHGAGPTSADVLTYVASDETPGSPRAGYLERVVVGAEAHALPAAYLTRLKRWRSPETGSR